MLRFEFSLAKSNCPLADNRLAAELRSARPIENSPLAAVIEQTDDPDRILAALFTLGGAESVGEVRVEGAAVYRSPA